MGLEDDDIRRRGNSCEVRRSMDCPSLLATIKISEAEMRITDDTDGPVTVSVSQTPRI